jgi:hypothetical protein
MNVPDSAMTDKELKTLLAAMLPEKLDSYPNAGLWWIDTQRGVQETEWLHVCWLVEQGLDQDTYYKYEKLMDEIVPAFRLTSASWQQRASALCKVRGVVA